MNVTLSTGVYDEEFAEGSFASSATARQCGSTAFLPGGFLFGFPHDIDPRDVEDVSFSALALAPGTSTSSFSISVSISEAAAGAHPKTFLDPSTQSTDTGSAQLTVANGTRTLTVDTAGEGGVTIHLTAVCRQI